MLQFNIYRKNLELMMFLYFRYVKIRFLYQMT
nr:MAG TPA: hypothetical protein [Crassvirales sp.]